MKSFLQYLESNEAIALMYAADELSSEDRAEVEHKLASDDNLAQELRQILQSQKAFSNIMQRLDRAQRLPISQAAAVRQVSRALTQWGIDRLAPKAPPPLRRGLRLPWWSYPMATAAAMLLSLLVWWVQRPEVRIEFGQRIDVADFAPSSVDGQNDGDSLGEVGLVQDEELAAQLQDSFDNSDEVLGNQLYMVEQQLMGLSDLTANTSPIFPLDVNY